MGGVERRLATPAVVLLIAICAAQVTESQSSAHRCFVCVPRQAGTATEVHRMFPGSSPVLHCEDLRVDDTRFVRECPSGSVGCQTQTNGMHVTRTCGDVAINSCNTANSIKYCYCTGPLCNRPTAVPISSPSDDEDLTVEGSGVGHQRDPLNTRTPPTTVAVGPGTTSSTSAKTSDASRHGVATSVLLVFSSVLVLVGWQ